MSPNDVNSEVEDSVDHQELPTESAQTLVEEEGEVTLPKQELFLPILVEGDSVKEHGAFNQQSQKRKKLTTLQLSEFYSVLVERGVCSLTTNETSFQPSDDRNSECASTPFSEVSEVPEVLTSRAERLITPRAALKPRAFCLKSPRKFVVRSLHGRPKTVSVSKTVSTSHGSLPYIKFRAMFHKPQQRKRPPRTPQNSSNTGRHSFYASTLVCIHDRFS